MAINSYKEDVEIEIPPQYIEDYNIADQTEDFFNSVDLDAEPVLPHERLNKITALTEKKENM